MSTLQNLTHEKKQKVLKYSLIIAALYTIIIVFSAYTMYHNRELSNKKHALRMNPTGIEPGKTPPEQLPETGNYATVKIGSYVENVDNLLIKDSMWSVNFYVWFSWQGDAKLDPGGKLVIVDGIVNKKELLEDYHGKDGDNYQRYRISAKIIKFFDTARVPIEDHMLNIYVEDGAKDGTKLRYVADKTSNISSRLNIPGFKITSHSNVVKTHTYKSSYGDPRLSPDSKKVFSQYIAAIQIKRVDFGFYLKIFLSLFAALLLTLSSYFIKPSDVGPRFALPTGAYFGAVANTYLANSLLPTSGSFGLVDHVAGVGLFTIFISIATSLLSNYYARMEDKELSLALDRTMFKVVSICCVAANIIIPWCAR
ncbi:hypothetical protein [Candidatus Magnetomonas plexicatena]|uniref:hypothetical protein n=1 Tax=Candidatus Magnetomonas plexicatena TaxID=2552947 RepID=UPI001C799C75|nr:hypothetical protein E2O03_008590 [Nitrospirales bacterium LBB_01]